MESISQERMGLASESELDKEQLAQSGDEHQKKIEEAHGKLKTLQKMYEDLKLKIQLQLDQNEVVVKKKGEFAHYSRRASSLVNWNRRRQCRCKQS